MRSLFVVGPVLSWRERYVQNYVFAFYACGWGQVLFRNFWAGKVFFCVFVFPENKLVDITLERFCYTQFMAVILLACTQLMHKFTEEH
jgi:hypothetical protein